MPQNGRAGQQLTPRLRTVNAARRRRASCRRFMPAGEERAAATMTQWMRWGMGESRPAASTCTAQVPPAWGVRLKGTLVPRTLSLPQPCYLTWRVLKAKTNYAREIYRLRPVPILDERPLETALDWRASLASPKQRLTFTFLSIHS